MEADLLTGSIGELSPFHDTFGYFGDGVSLETARLPSGWQDRLIAIDNANTNGYVGLCLETHDLLISKYFAGREKDYQFCAAVVDAGLADYEQLLRRLSDTDLDPDERIRLERRIEADFASRGL